MGGCVGIKYRIRQGCSLISVKAVYVHLIMYNVGSPLVDVKTWPASLTQILMFRVRNLLQ